MNVKNILFGLGLGLVCSGAVLLLFRNQGNAELTDAEIKKRAEQLGMVEERQDAILTSELKELEKAESGDALDGGSEKADVKEEPAEDKIQTGAENVQGTEAGKQEESNADSGKAQAEEKKSTASEKAQKSDKKNTASEKAQAADKKNTASSASSKKKKKKKNTKTEEKQENDDKKESETITVEIKSGMTAGAICEAFQKQGIIENAEDFRNYLVQKKIQHKLRAGTFEFSKGADYEEIIREIYKG